jgi:hypothetical protein
MKAINIVTPMMRWRIFVEWGFMGGFGADDPAGELGGRIEVLS